MSKTKLPQVLIIEDNVDTQILLIKLLEGDVLVVIASTIEEAENHFSENPNFSLIVIDGCVPQNKDVFFTEHRLNTVDLAKKIRANFKGPIIASSSHEAYQEALLAAGCDCAFEKYELPAQIRQILDIPFP